MRIGLVVYGDLETVTGGNLYDRILVDHLERRGHTVEVLSLPRPGYLSCLAHNLSSGVAKRLDAADRDVLLQDELTHPSLLRANRRRRRPPVITIVHHLRSSERHPAPARLLYRAVERLYLASVDACVYNSETTRASVESLLRRSLPHVVATPGGDRLPGAPLAAATVETRAREDGPLRALFVGNLIPRKGLAVLLDALRCLPAGSVELEVLGAATDPAYAAALERRARSLESGAVSFRGAVSDAVLAERYATSHVLVVPSTWEGFGIVTLEAMGFGLPVLGTTAGGAREIVEPGRNGDLLAPGDAGSLARHLADLAADRDRLATWSREALRTFARFPRWSDTCARVESFVASLVAARGEDRALEAG
jgi:glycosyltransferase involved in cell wall biosynthesis